MLVCCFDAQQKRNRKTKVRHIMELLLLLRGLLYLTNFESQNYVCACYEYCFDAPMFFYIGMIISFGSGASCLSVLTLGLYQKSFSKVNVFFVSMLLFFCLCYVCCFSFV